MGYSIFICYRRVDSEPITRRIYERLSQRFGEARVYMDVASPLDGASFPETHREIIKRAKVLLVVIGPQWLTIQETPQAGRRSHPRPRLKNPDDYVRSEIETALDAGTRIIPILVDGAERPEAYQLPLSIRALATRTDRTIRSDTASNFDEDMAAVVKQVQHVLSLRRIRSGGCLAPAFAALLILALVAAGIYQNDPIFGSIPFLATPLALLPTPLPPTPTPLPPPPTANFAYGETGFFWGCSITFDASATSHAGSLDYSWDFGDGATDDAGSSAQASHSYIATGTYTVTLTVTDQSQQSTEVTKSVYSADSWNCA